MACLTQRWTLADLLDIRTSPIAKCADDWLRLLQHFHGEFMPWFLFSKMGGGFRSDQARRWTRSYNLQLQCSLYEHFVHRMSGPPYSLIEGAADEVPHVRQTELFQDFLNYPWHCLSLFCRQLRTRCTDIEIMRQDDKQIIHVWSHSAKHAIDFSERSHNALRQELHS